MDEDEFEESQSAASVAAPGEKHTPPAELPTFALPGVMNGSTSEPHAGVMIPDTAAFRSDIAWVRASDLLNTGTGRIAGRGIDFEAELARRMRRTPATTRRAIRERADRLPPLSEFGPLIERPPFFRYGLGRR